MHVPYHVVTVFAKPEYAMGNQAAIFLEENNKAVSFDEQVNLGIDIADNQDIETTCFITAVSEAEYQVQCFNGKNKIQCCGHGMIAAAETLFSHNNQSEIILNENIIASRENTKTNSHFVKLKIPRLNSINTPVTAWAAELFRIGKQYLVPAYSAVTESEDGYLLFEFDYSITVETFRLLQPDLEHIANNTQRAVVAISFDNTNQHCYSRYFAPQYGNDEDSATGSVMRFVADYIEQKYQVTQFDVRQCSATGGVMQVSCDEYSVSITAPVSMEVIP